eukprot:TRINITY_DN6558_c2_g1_i1.p4 TRINITY_DN6558_c2_g1~~TRINITY_DN6558_c2_g1_i1.p4  ORF type:complete len:137 (+),score=20.71 TRINITY_DN6558_c2_g1_i1:89-499(+)
MAPVCHTLTAVEEPCVRAASPAWCPAAPALRPADPPMPPPSFSPSLLGGSAVPVMAVALLEGCVADTQLQKLGMELGQMSLTPTHERGVALKHKPKTILRSLRRSRKKKSCHAKGPRRAEGKRLQSQRRLFAEGTL